MRSTPKREVAVLYRGDTFERWPGPLVGRAHDGDWQFGHLGVITLGPAKRGVLEQQRQAFEASGWVPWRVGANGLGAEARFCLTMVREDAQQPLPRVFVVRDALELVSPTPAFVTASTPDETQASLLTVDGTIRSWMKQRAARAAQLAVTVDGELRLMRSYTFAEDGFRTTRHTDRFLIGSVSKMLTAIRLVTLLSPGGERGPIEDQTLSVAFGLNALSDKPAAERDYWANVTVEHLLRQTTGFRPDREPNEFAGLDVDKLPWDAAIAATNTKGKRPNLPGDFRRFFRSYDGVLFAAPPGAMHDYNNFNFVAAAELVGRSGSPDEAFSGYEDAMQGWWGLPLKAVPRPTVWRRYVSESFALPTDPVPDSGTSWIGSTPSVEPSVASNEALFPLGAGHWAMSAATLLRILACLDPDSPALAVPPLTRDQLTLLTSERPAFPTVGLGVGVETLTDPASNLSMRRIWHPGLFPDGGCSVAGMYLTEGANAPWRSMGVAILLACGAPPLDRTHLDVVRAKISEALANGGLSAVDLFPLFTPVP